MAIDLRLNGDGCWLDLFHKDIIEVRAIGVAALRAGMKSGRPSVAIRVDLPDNRAVFAQVSMREFLACADALRVRYDGELE